MPPSDDTFEYLLIDHLEPKPKTRPLVIVVRPPTITEQRHAIVIIGEKPRVRTYNYLRHPLALWSERLYQPLASFGLVLFLFAVLMAQSGLLSEQFAGWRTMDPQVSLHESKSNILFTLPQSRRTEKTIVQPVTRISYEDPSQYYNEYQRWTWGPSACSGLALAMVMKSYGTHVRVADITYKQIELGVWSVELGLLYEAGLAQTASHFGFNTNASRTRSLNEIIDLANKGKPVIVSIRDPYYFPAGHFLVISGGNSHSVFFTDSSPFNFQQMSHQEFFAIWQTYSAVLTPR